MTTYHVAESDMDYMACRALMADVGIGGELAFPTIMAIHDDELVGFLATRPADDMVLAGPLVMAKGPRRPFTAINLIEHYRVAMRNMGISRIIFGVDSDDSFVKKGLARWFPEMTPYSDDDGEMFYVWPID